MKRHVLFPVLFAAIGLSAGCAQSQTASLYGSWGVSAPGMQVGISNAPMLNLPAVVYSRPVAAPMSYGFGYGVDRRHPYGRIYSQNFAPAYGAAYGAGYGPDRVIYGTARRGDGHDREDFRPQAWGHEQQERHEWAERRAQHARFEHDRGDRPGTRRF